MGRKHRAKDLISGPVAVAKLKSVRHDLNQAIITVRATRHHNRWYLAVAVPDERLLWFWQCVNARDVMLQQNETLVGDFTLQDSFLFVRTKMRF